MKKSFMISLMVFILSLCLIIPGYCKGELGDNDAFSAYMGRTRSEVRKIAPLFEEMEDSDGWYIVDWLLEDDDLAAICVKFDDYNLVDAVMIMVTPSTLKRIELDTDMLGATTFGMITLGFEVDDIKRNTTDEDGNLILYLKGGITIAVIKMSEKLYTIMAMQ